MAGGMRAVADEKQLLSELGKLFHTVKANHKERVNQRKAANAAASGSGKGGKKAAKKEGGKTTRRHTSRSRKNRGGGSVWITLKGGFAASAVPAQQDKRRVDGKCFSRGAMGERTRLSALEAAEAYIASAWAAAAEAGIAELDSSHDSGAAAGGRTTCDDGVVYMREQFAVAVQMLDRAVQHAPGAALRRVVEDSVGGSSAKGAAAASPSQACASVVEKSEVNAYRRGVEEQKGTTTTTAAATGRMDWEDVATRELAIRQNPFTSSLSTSGGGGGSAAVAAEEAFKATVADGGQSYYYRLAEPASSTAPNDIAATKCIVRVRNSQREKHTAILSSQKAVNYFKSNFIQVLKKELSNSKLPRGTIVEEGGSGGATATASDHRAQQKHHNQQQQQQQQGGKHKKRGKR